MNYKKDFPIFTNNSDLIFFDSTASSQKPTMVIEGIKHFLENSYSNIHRGMYDIAIESEKLYNDSKKIVAKHLEANYKEIIYTANSTYASNLLAQSLKKSGWLKKWDTVLTSIVEHHANIVPWLILKEEIGINVEFIDVDEEYNLDFEDFAKKYDDSVKVISLTQVSNVTGQIFDLEQVGKLKREETLFVVDASQSIPHIPVSVKKLNCDFLFFTGHKIFADSGIGVLWGKKQLLEKMTPAFSGGGAISEVYSDSFTPAQVPDKFEPGTPNMTGAVSLLKAFEYVESIWGFSVLEKHEQQLTQYFLEKLEAYPNITLIGGKNVVRRVGVFSLVFEDLHSHDVAEMFADKGIAVRSGRHCAHPFLRKIEKKHSLRVSFSIYNDTNDIDTFFEVVEKIQQLSDLESESKNFDMFC